MAFRPATVHNPRNIIDVIFELAKRLGKCVDVHIDQENNPLENETELLARKTIEHGIAGPRLRRSRDFVGERRASAIRTV